MLLDFRQSQRPGVKGYFIEQAGIVIIGSKIICHITDADCCACGKTGGIIPVIAVFEHAIDIYSILICAIISYGDNMVPLVVINGCCPCNGYTVAVAVSKIEVGNAGSHIGSKPPVRLASAAGIATYHY